MPFNQSINRFRARRGEVLRKLIQGLATELQRDIVILDIGGRADYWENVGNAGIRRIDLLNLDDAEFSSSSTRTLPDDLFRNCIGDARDLSAYDNQSVDLVHSNSVIEHVGYWADMAAMATEARRVGRAGWIQTPAWAFPIEAHFHLPFAHWFGRPVVARMLSASPIKHYRRGDLAERRWHAEQVNLLSKAEVKALFPNADIYTEWFVFPKSYSVHWGAGSPELQTADLL